MTDQKLLVNHFQSVLEQERPRLVRYCAWLTGDMDAAEDLVQEAMLSAWQNQSQLKDPQKAWPWLKAIARNAGFRWLKSHRREHEQKVPYPSWEEEGRVAGVSAGFDLDAQLDQSDLARLLERAITTLPAQTSKILLEHYLEGTPHSELAQKLGVSAGLVAVRLQRARRSLQRLLQTDPQAQALAYGIAAGSSSVWEETNIWCPACGQCRFWGQFHTEFPGARFMLRCPRCHPAPGSIGVMVDLAIPYYRQLFGGVRAYKPAYTRLFTGIASYYQQALHAHQAVCMACGHPAGVHRIPKETREHPGLRRDIEVRIVCPACGWASNSTLSGLAMALPETQQFWRQNPRMQTLPVEEIETQGTLAYLTRLQSITTTAELAVISRKDTLEPLGIQGPIKL